MISKSKTEDILGISNTRKVDSRRIKRILFEIIHFDIKHSIIVVELIFIRILLKIGFLILGYGSQIMDIERATLINTGINKELLAVMLFCRGLPQ
jgi:hypothetical protein